MKKIIAFFAFIITSSIALAQYPNCTVYVTNTTSHDLAVGVQTTTNTPNVCATGPFSTGPFMVPAGAVNMPISLGVAPLPAPAIRPFRVGCFWVAGMTPPPGTPSWQVNTCWNPSCVASDGSYNITYVNCGDYETYVTISF